MKNRDLHFDVKHPILACGADMKGAFAFAKGRKAVLEDGFGDLGDLDNFTRYEKAVRDAEKRLKLKPKIVACDLHPGYFSAHFAENYAIHNTQYPIRKIQHHEAHIASAIADNAIRGSVIGVAFDGTGYGLDGNIWGGEFFVGDPADLKRVAHFEYVAMPGGDAAVRQPWRMAASYLYHIYGEKFLKLGIEFVKRLDKDKWAVLKNMIDNNTNSPLTSSAGRLFDAVGSLVLLKGYAAKEAELPIELEKLATGSCRGVYGFEIKTAKGMLTIGFSKMMKGIVKDLACDVDRAVISSKFHNTVAGAIEKTALDLSRRFKIKKVVLSGGVFQNKYLIKRTLALLRKDGLDGYAYSKIETGDSGIPMGQIAIANARAVCV